MSKSRDEGAPAYKDPLSLRNASYHRGKKSDVFSLGVILWEISSGETPCDGCTETVGIIMYRLNGSRDPPFPGTPDEYVNLYSECWNED
ncbi:6860_t:CDS:1, partial [Paraglomus occultum]